MKVSLVTLSNLLQQNVLEIKFLRRRQVTGKPPTRRMLCTSNDTLLKSEPGRKLLNYRDPVKKVQYNPSGKNITIVWDILVQDFRAISVDECEVLAMIESQEEFWKYYNDVLFPMTPEQKTAFMLS